MPESGWRPALRGELHLAQAGPSGAALWDPVVNRQINLGAISQAFVERLDGTRTPGQLVDEVAALHPDRPRATVEHTLRTLLLMNLVDGAGREILARARDVRSGRVALEPVALPGARFQCQGSGGCCQNYRFGPLAEADVRRIEALDVRAAFPHLEPPYVIESEWADGLRHKSLRSVDDRCVFLLDDQRCGLHAAFGAQAKPGFCRRYPLHTLATLDGLKIYDSGECTSFAAAARSGAPLAEQAAELNALLREEGDELALEHPIVFLDGETPCDYGHWLLLLRLLLAIVDGEGTAGARLAAVARATRGFVAALRTCPLEPGQPDRAVAEVAGAQPASHVAPVEPPEPEALRALIVVASDLTKLIAPSLRHETPEAGRLPVLTPRLASELAAVLHLVQTVAAHHADPDAAPLPDHYREVLELPADRALLDEVLRLSQRNRLFGHEALIAERPAPAQAHFAVAALVTAFGARLYAVIDGAARVEERHYSFAHMLATRMMRRPSVRELFAAHEEHAWELVAAAAGLLG